MESKKGITFLFKINRIVCLFFFVHLEYDSGAVTSLPYYIGASFNNTLMAWKWINGFSVDPFFLSMYSVPNVTDTCLTWNHLDTLQEFPCILKHPYLCEIPT